jgi:hypothetical protein
MGETESFKVHESAQKRLDENYCLEKGRERGEGEGRRKNVGCLGR